MESMNLLDITIKYFNLIIFVLCVVFGMLSFFASWIAWREIHRKRNIIRSVIAAYNITEDTVDKARTPAGEFDMDPSVMQTIFSSLQEILNSIYGEVTGKPMPPRDERSHGSRRSAGARAVNKVFGRKESEARLNVDKEVPTLVPDDRERHQGISAP